jgi:hypothetical protein
MAILYFTVVLNGGKYYHIFNGQEVFGICNNLKGPAFFVGVC